MVHTRNPCTQEAEAEGPQVQGRPDLKIESLSLKQQQKQRKMGGVINLWVIKTESLYICIQIIHLDISASQDI